MNRRQFLHPRHLAQATGQVLGAAQEIRDALRPESGTPDFSLLHFQRRAMATTFEVALPFGLPAALPAAESALDEIDRLEQQLTVYRDDSEVSRLNQLARQRPVVVEEGLFRLIAECATLHAETDGAFDITAGALIKAWGFFRGPPHVPSREEIAAARMQVGMKNVALDPATRTVRLLRPGLEFNLGSVGKGYALDVIADRLVRDWNVPSGLLHGGRSSVYAIGCEPGSERGWAVGLCHPWQPDRRLGLLRLRDRAVGTSAATFKHLEHEGRKLGHILDPRTGWPSAGIASATAVAPTAAVADALATSFFILGVERTREYCAAHPEVGAVILPDDGTDTPLVINLSQEECRVVTG